MGQKGLSPDAQFILTMLYKLLNDLERHEQKYEHSKKYVGKEALDQFIRHLEKELGIIDLR